MKILFITNQANTIGAFSIASIYASHNMGIEFHMGAAWSISRDDINDLENRFNVKIHDIDLVRSPYSLKNYTAYKQILKIIKEENIDYIHCNTPVGGMLGRLAGKKCKVKKVIYQVHGFHFYKGASKLNWLIYYPVEKWLARYTDALVTINHEDFEFAKKKMKFRNNGKVYYVPGVGIDASQFGKNEKSGIKRKELNIPEDAFVIISVGELNVNKNNKVIISALEQLKNSNIHYVACGVGEEEQALKQQANNAGLQDNVHFIGYRNDLKELYNESDCFVMPSYREGLSRSIMEAMASGLPCIVSKIRGNVDMIDENKGGFLCAPDDVSGFAEAINKIATDEELRKNMQEYNKEAIKKFDISVVKAEMEKIYSEVFN